MRVYCLSGSTLEGLAEHEKLSLIVYGEYTSASDTTENVGTCTFEEGLNTFLGNNLASGIGGGLVLDGLLRLLANNVHNVNLQRKHLLHQTSSSCVDGWCQEGRTQYRHQW